MKTIYLDYAAATPVDPAVLKVMWPYFSDKFYNPSATYLVAQEVAQDVEAARQSISKWLGAKPSEIVFTAGGTEANNLAINGIMQAFPDGNIVTSAIEHESVLKPSQQYRHKVVKVKADGLIDLIDLKRKINDQTVLVSVIYANNEIGTIEPIRQISQLLAEIRQTRKSKDNKLPLYFHTDACQVGAYLDLHVNRLGVDLMTVNGGKIYGPKQSGLLYIKTRTAIRPQILGGGQELGWRSGTQNVPAIVGLAKALDLAQTKRIKESQRILKLRQLFIDLVKKQIPTAKINGSLSQRLPNNLNLSLIGQDNERLMMQLDEMGIICATGSACSASSDEPSHVLKAIGLELKDIKASLRFSLGQQTTAEQITQTVKSLKKCL